MGTNAITPARSIDVTGLSDEAIRAVESLVGLLRSVPGEKSRPGETGQDTGSFEQQLDELSESLPPLHTLPQDFSRADMYGDHP